MNSRLIRETLPTDAAAPAANDAAPSASGPDLGDSRLYIHRELSQLKFNIRVLDQALDERTPLLERLTFLLIF
ncbi:MAG: RNA degradosome polyphosphate kinase, partial [Rhodanobacter sp.]